MSGHLMEPNRDNKGFKGAVRNVKKSQKESKCINKGRLQSWRTFFKDMGETRSILASSHVRVPYRTNQRQWGHPRTHQERPKVTKTARWMIFTRNGSLDALFLRLLVETQVVLDFSHVSVPYETNQRQWRLQRRRQERQKLQKIAKKRQNSYFHWIGPTWPIQS